MQTIILIVNFTYQITVGAQQETDHIPSNTAVEVKLSNHLCRDPE